MGFTWVEETLMLQDSLAEANELEQEHRVIWEPLWKGEKKDSRFCWQHQSCEEGEDQRPSRFEIPRHRCNEVCDTQGFLFSLSHFQQGNDFLNSQGLGCSSTCLLSYAFAEAERHNHYRFQELWWRRYTGYHKLYPNPNRAKFTGEHKFLSCAFPFCPPVPRPHLCHGSMDNLPWLLEQRLRR